MQPEMQSAKIHSRFSSFFYPLSDPRSRFATLCARIISRWELSAEFLSVGIRDSSPILERDPTPASFSCQSQIASRVKPLLKCPLSYLVRNVPFFVVWHLVVLALFCFGLRTERSPAPRVVRRV